MNTGPAVSVCPETEMWTNIVIVIMIMIAVSLYVTEYNIRILLIYYLCIVRGVLVGGRPQAFPPPC